MCIQKTPVFQKSTDLLNFKLQQLVNYFVRSCSVGAENLRKNGSFYLFFVAAIVEIVRVQRDVRALSLIALLQSFIPSESATSLQLNHCIVVLLKLCLHSVDVSINASDHRWKLIVMVKYLMQVDYWKISNVLADGFRVTWSVAITHHISDVSNYWPLNLEFVVRLLLYDSLHCALGTELHLLINSKLDWLPDWYRWRDLNWLWDWSLHSNWLWLLDWQKPRWLWILDWQRPRWLKAIVIECI